MKNGRDDIDFNREDGKYSLFPPTFSLSCPTPTGKSQSLLPNRWQSSVYTAISAAILLHVCLWQLKGLK